MENRNRKILDIDDRPKGRKGIEKMLQHLANTIEDEETDMHRKNDTTSMERSSDNLTSRLLSGEKVSCYKCGRGVLRPGGKEEHTDVSKCPCFICDNCGCAVNIDFASTADLVVF